MEVLKMFERCNECPIKDICGYNRRPGDTCETMVNRYNAGLLLPLEAFKESAMN